MGGLLEREVALRSLHAVLATAGQGRGSVAVVSGEPGIGKSVLLDRFAGLVTNRARVLVGMCDDLTTPRPLGPFLDIAQQVGGTPPRVPVAGRSPGEVAALVLGELDRTSSPTLLAIEDVHWADQASIDVITLIGRRIAEHPAVLLLTLRPGELEPADPLRATLDAVRRSITLHLELAPLSRRAVRQLAGERGEQIYELSQGNPFFVTELLEHGDAPPARSLATAVLGRVSRLDPTARELLELLCLVPGRVSTQLLDLLDPSWAVTLEQAERRGLLRIDTAHVRFRHELTRDAVGSGLTSGRRRLLHRRIAEALVRLDADPAEVVHQAEAAGMTELAASHALPAGLQAAGHGAHREAYTHLRRATRGAEERLGPRERLELYEELARAAWLTGRLEEASSTVTQAIVLARRLDDHACSGRAAALRARLHWFRGDGAAAWRDATDAVHDLEARGPSPELARAYAQAAELSMLCSRTAAASRWGRHAMELADDDDATRTRALSAIAGSRLQLDPGAATELIEVVELAREAGEVEQVVFSLVTLAYLQQLWLQPATARDHAVRARTCAEEHELDGMAAFIRAFLVWLELREGRPQAVADLPLPSTTQGPDTTSSMPGLLARMVLAELAVRTGAAGAAERLDEVAAALDRTRELVLIAPVLGLQVEQALVDDTPLPRERFSQLAAIVGPEPLQEGCAAAHVAAWAAVCGVSTGFRGRAPAPLEAMIAGRWQEAAEGFAAVGWRHDRALLLSLLATPEALHESLELARSRGAAPLARRVTQRLRALGLRVPRGPRSSTQTNPSQLTDRQLEVLHHLRAGRSNADIAASLHLSPRTVEHHVAGILAKLGAASRVEAVARAAERGIT